MKRLIAAAILASITAPPLLAQPARSSTDAPFTCLFEGVTAEQRALGAPAASQRLTDVPADGEQRGGAALSAILAALPRCAEAGRWSSDQRELAELYVLAQLAREDMRRRYAAQNVDLAFVDEAVAVPLGASAPSLDDMAARLRAQGVIGNRPDSAEDIAFIYSALARQAEGAKAAFADLRLNSR